MVFILLGFIAILSYLCFKLKNSLDTLKKNLSIKQKDEKYAQSIFSKIVYKKPEQHPNIKFYTKSMSSFNGDIFLSHATNLTARVFLGDFTGHGLSAALGAIPLSEKFEMHKISSLKDAVHSINGFLYDLLPTSIFCVGYLLDIDFKERKITIWRGGMHDFISSIPDKKYELSKNLPLGIVSSEQYTVSIDTFNLSEKENIYLFTDGLVDLKKNEKSIVGYDKVKSILVKSKFDFNITLNYLEEKGYHQTDDISFLEIALSKIDIPMTLSAKN